MLCDYALYNSAVVTDIDVVVVPQSNSGECWCSGSAQQLVSVMNHSGEMLSTVKYHEGFMGQRIAPVNCIAFHPLQVS